MSFDHESLTVIAEMAWAHDGSIEKAIRIMRAAKSAGAHAFGIHVTDLPTYMVRHYGSGEGRVSAGKESDSVYKYLESINPSKDDWRSLGEEAKSISIDLCVMANDLNSLDFCEEALKPRFYVASAAAFVEKPMIDAIAATNRDTVFRIGGATLGEIDETLTSWRSSSTAKSILLHGFQNYPTKIEETNISQIAVLKDLFGGEVGLADHIDGDDPIATTIPALALAYGATVIEKHITWDRAERGEDFEAALGPTEFARFVTYLLSAQVALGTKRIEPLSPAAQRYRSVSRKRLVAAKDLEAGSVIDSQSFAYKRADIGFPADQVDSLIGRTLRHSLQIDDGITSEELA